MVNYINNTKYKKLIETRKSIMRAIIAFEVIYMLLIEGIFASLPIVSNFHYILDITNIILLCGVLLDIKSVCNIKNKWILFPWIIYAGVCIISSVINAVPLMLFLWAVRNTFRFMVFFIACLVYINKQDIKKFFKYLLLLQYINFVLVIIEFVYIRNNRKKIDGLWLDRIGGIFGVELGVSGILNIYLVIIFTLALAEALQINKLTKRFIFICSSSLICAALSEIKFFYIEVVLIFVITLALYLRSVKLNTVLKLGCVIVVSTLISFVLLKYYVSFAAIKQIINYNDYEQSASDVYKISRSTAFSQINELFFKDSVLNKAIGLGFGNCESGKFSFMTSEFFIKNGMYNYRWFSHQMIYLETGLIGFLTFAFVPLIIAIEALVNGFKEKSGEFKFVAVFTAVFAALMFANLWYNNCIRTDFAYVIYFAMSAFAVLRNSQSRKII